MRLPGYALAFLLAVLLVCTTPIGTGAGAHQLDLLHPLFSHVHVVNGRIMTHEQLAETGGQLAGDATTGTALGAGGGGGLADDGLALNPVSIPSAGLVIVPRVWKWLSEDRRLATGREEAPPDPPPVT